LAFLPGDRYANEINEPRMTCVESIREAYGMHYPDQRRKKVILNGKYSSSSVLSLSIDFLNFSHTLCSRSGHQFTLIQI
jgi:hypothetical protein